MKNGMFVPATQCKSHPNVKSDGKARVDTGKPTLTQQGMDVDAISALQRTAFQSNDKVVYGFATKLLTGELMDIKANYSKDAK